LRDFFRSFIVSLLLLIIIGPNIEYICDVISDWSQNQNLTFYWLIT